MTTSRRHMLAFAVLALLATGGCADPQSPSGPGEAQPATDQRGDAVADIGDVSVRASATQTSMLPESVAREYGLDRSPRTILLLVNLRGVGSAPAPVISATVTDLLGHATPVSLRAAHIAQADAGTVDYVGTVDATLPDTLRFTVVARRGDATATLEVSRDYYPQ
ncbi:DUF4426 domain-containing protein [Cognatiluteimonas profundi]|uniref:DUF4426 domain-containing protein n=1 Tax=Cognatiluteimonas profundi TaxID=2594501 RepID=UPI00131C2719|nr:DUF4426 domain-containing protein [Lysobacter profundi]